MASLNGQRQGVIFNPIAYHGKPFLYDQITSYDILRYKIPIRDKLPPLTIQVYPSYGEIELYVSQFLEQPTRLNCELIVK